MGERWDNFCLLRIPNNQCRTNEENGKTPWHYSNNGCRQDSAMNAEKNGWRFKKTQGVASKYLLQIFIHSCRGICSQILKHFSLQEGDFNFSLSECGLDVDS